MRPIKVNAKYQITIPKSVREMLDIKVGNHLLLDVQDGVMVLIPEPKSYTDYLQGLPGEIWKGLDVMDYRAEERGAWTSMANE